MPILDGLEATRLIRAFESTQHAYRSALIVCVTARYLYPIPPDVASAGFDIFLNKPFRVPLLYDMFLGGPETNIAMLYGCLTEEEKRAYPRRMIQETVLGDDPRSNAITDELNSPAGSNGNDLGICRAYFTKIIVKVIKAGEDEDGVRKGNKGEQVMKTEATDRRAFARR
jgi:CheY-like chemotaxis protein